jgi:hypothetical protein
LPCARVPVAGLDMAISSNSSGISD